MYTATIKIIKCGCNSLFNWNHVKHVQLHLQVFYFKQLQLAYSCVKWSLINNSFIYLFASCVNGSLSELHNFNQSINILINEHYTYANGKYAKHNYIGIAGRGWKEGNCFYNKKGPFLFLKNTRLISIIEMKLIIMKAI